MNRNLRLFSLAAAGAVALFAVGCTRDPAVDETGGGEGAAQVNIVGQTGHRVVGDYWYEDHIGVIVTDAPTGSGMTAKYRNVEYGTEASEATSAEFTAVSETIVFDTKGSVTVAAYAPYSYTADISTLPGTDGVISGSVKSQKDSDLDWLYASGQSATESSPDVSFEFKHVMSKVLVSVVHGSGMSGEEVVSGSFTLSGLILDGAFDVAPGSATAGTAYTDGTVTDAWSLNDYVPSETIYEDDGETVKGVTYTAIVYPQSDALTFKATINNLPFTADLTESEIESFEAGKAYTFTLTLSQTGLNLSGCTITDWDDTDYDDLTLSQGYNPNDLILTYTLTDADTEVILPLYDNVDCTVDWGDGTVETVTDAWPTHTYLSAGEYDVLIDGTVTRLNSNDIGSSAELLTKVKQWGKTGLTSMDYAFEGCTALASIPGDTRGSFSDVTSFFNAFDNCSSLASIPESLFANCSSVTDMREVFFGCSSLTEIPENLFADCTRASSFINTFYNCSSLTSIPEKLFANCLSATDFDNTFRGCSSLKTIPENLFANNTEVTSFFSTFCYCSSLTGIPENLFVNNTNVTDFQQLFYGCTSLTGESAYDVRYIDGVETKVHLYERYLYPDTYTEPTSYGSCYLNCSKLDDYDYIPSAWGGGGN